MAVELKQQVAQVAESLGIPGIDSAWTGVGAVWSVLEKIADEGAILVVKLDGERTSPDDGGRYTILVSGAKLGGDFFRVDTADIDEGLAKAILFCADKFWR